MTSHPAFIQSTLNAERTMPEAHFYKMPNGKIVEVDEQGYTTAEVLFDVDDFIGQDLEGFLDTLCERAVGSTLLMDVAYRALRVESGSVVIEVTGRVDEILDLDGEDGEPAQPLSLDELPTRDFEVKVTRTAWGHLTLKVQARTPAEAIAIASEQAGDHVINSHDADYAYEVL